MSDRRSTLPRLARLVLTAGAVWIASFSMIAQTPPAQSPAPATAGAQPPGAQPAGTAPGQGRGRGSISSELADFSTKDPYLPRTPADEAKGFILPPGYRMELVVSDPEVISPSIVEFDGNGRMYVGEMRSYMMDAEASREHDPINRISRWESSRGDGHYDRHTVFVDHLVAPRMILPLQDGVILTSETDSDDLVKWTDTNGDGVADKREVVFTGIGQSGDANIEHQKAGLVWNMDNWLYTTYNAFRIRLTPSGFIREPTGANGGQWGLSHDDDGKPWFVDAGGERGPMNFQFPIHYGGFTPCGAAGGARGRRAFGAPAAAPAPPPPPADPDCPTAFEKDFEVVWPAPGIGDMQGGLGRTRMPAQNLNHFTAATGPEIFRGHRLPEDMKGDLFFTEPVGRLIRRAKIVKIDGLTQLRNAYPGSEFLTSQDQLFRPVNLRTGPDGTLYVADMYHGIIQELQWSGPGTYLRAKIEQYQLDKIAAFGRIWRLRYDGRAAVPVTATNPGQPAIAAIQPDFAPPHMYSETPAQLVAHLSHPNGWWRDMAQRLLILKQDKSAVAALQQLTRSSDNLLARFHALWTLEGLGALDPSLVRAMMEDQNPRMRIQAIRASETLYKAGDKTFDADYHNLAKDRDSDVMIQALLTLSLFKAPDLADVVRSAQASNKARGVKEIGDRLLAPPAANAGVGGGRGGAALTPEQQNLLQQGRQIFTEICSTCHGDDARGKPLAGASPGVTMAPPLAGSPRVNGHRDYVIKAVLGGLTGPIGDKTYTEVMVPMSANKDEWIAAVTSYVRSSFGNNADLVSPADVARVRAATTSRKAPWTVAELEATLPRLIPTETLNATASDNAANAPNSLTLRAWSSAGPQTAGMWFQVELTQPAMVTEIQFDSPAGRGGGAGGNRGGARGAFGAAPAPGAAPPAVGFGAGTPPPPPAFPVAYRVQVSMDGSKWTQPVAEGKGAGTRTTISFKPVQARFVRITQTAAEPNASNWTISGLRLFEAGK